MSSLTVTPKSAPFLGGQLMLVPAGVSPDTQGINGVSAAATGLISPDAPQTPMGGLGAPMKVSTNVSRAGAVSHRTAVTAVDLVLPVSSVTPSGLAGGSLTTTTTYYAAVAVGNRYGSAGLSPIISQSTGSNTAVRLAFAAPANVLSTDYYDIFLSTDVGAPLWVGRITETQRASGIVLSAVGTTSAGGAAGSVDVRVPGTGVSTAALSFANNNAWILAGLSAPVVCTGRSLAYVYVQFSVTDLRSLPQLVLCPFYQNSNNSLYYQGQAFQMNVLGGPALSYWQVFTLSVDGAMNMGVGIQALSGQGASVTIDIDLV